MAKIIEFYRSERFRSKSKWIPEEQRGKVIEFRPRPTRVRETAEQLPGTPPSRRAAATTGERWSWTCLLTLVWSTPSKSTRALEQALSTMSCEHDRANAMSMFDASGNQPYTKR